MLIAGGINAEYVMNDMEGYEIDVMLRAAERAQRAGWEQARLVAVTSANAMGAKLRMKDLQFPWEKDNKKNDSTPRETEIRDLKEKVAKLKNGKENQKNTSKIS
jgi:hypothetical protein